jgi:hypothetical protein
VDANSRSRVWFHDTYDCTNIQFGIIAKAYHSAKATMRFIPSQKRGRHLPSHHKSLCTPRRKCQLFMIENALHMPANSIATNHSLCTIPCHKTPRKLFIPTDTRQIRTYDNTKHERKLNTQNSDNFRYGAAGYTGCC